MQLFTSDALVIHPIFGTLAARKFFLILLDKAQDNKITILNILQALEQSNRLACYLNVEFITKNNQLFTEEAVHIYDFQENALISKLIVIVDTHLFHE